MAESKDTEAERAAYKRGLEAAKKKGKRGGSGSTAARTKTRRTRSKGRKSKGTPKRASGCIYYNAGTWARQDGTPGEVPKIFAWRYFGKGANRKKQTMTAYPSKDGGAPRNGTSADICTVWVCNIVTVGESSSVETGVFSNQYEKLSITKLGLVANPKLAGGGYFGRGGSAYQGKVK